MYKCLCAAVTEDQIKELEKLNIDKRKIYDILNVGKDCGICIKGEKNDNRHKKSKIKISKQP